VTGIPLSRSPVDDEIKQAVSHRQPAVQWLAAPALPETERLGHEILSLPISADHTEAEIDEIAAAVREFFAG
jgi:dTDP-4-amino-4,6-dideoxygalactose transaminase